MGNISIGKREFISKKACRETQSLKENTFPSEKKKEEFKKLESTTKEVYGKMPQSLKDKFSIKSEPEKPKEKPQITHETWVKFIKENHSQMTKEQLIEMKKKLSLFHFGTEDDIKLIDGFIEQTKAGSKNK